MHSPPQITHMPNLQKRQPNLGGLQGRDEGPWAQWVTRSRVQSSKASAFLPKVADKRKRCIHSSHERPGPWFSFHESVGWAGLQGGCATLRVCHSSSGRMRSFLESSSFLQHRVLISWPSPLCPLLILKTTPNSTSVHWHHSWRTPSLLQRHY